MKKSHFLLIGALVIISLMFIIFMKTPAKQVASVSIEPVTDNPPVLAAPKPPVDQGPVIILTYHSIEAKPEKKEGPTQLHYRITPDTFEKQMQYLKENGYTPITFNALVQHFATGSTLPEKPIVLTFDDGWKDQSMYAVPILKKFGFTGTFFIITKLRAGKYMSWDEVKNLHADGFEIASHTETHPKLPLLDDGKLVEEIVGSKKILEEQLGSTITTLAYPYYLHDARVMKAVQDAGYLGARAGWGKFADDKEHIFELKSQEPVNNSNPFSTKRLAD